MQFLILFIVILLVLFAVIWFRKNNTEVAIVKSTIDGRDYVVQNKPDKQEAANMLAQVRQKMIRLVDYLKRTGGKLEKSKEQDDQSQYGSYEERVNRLVSRFNPDRISEGNEDTKFTTYTLNKGDKVVFCLRARGEDDRVHDLSMMTFVAIHEMGHITSISSHHSDEFRSNFAWLLENAVKAGIYTPENFRSRPRNYCGIAVTDTPLNQF
jgi:hypothetical protein